MKAKKENGWRPKAEVLFSSMLDPRPNFKGLLRGAKTFRLDLGKENGLSPICEFIPKYPHMVR